MVDVREHWLDITVTEKTLFISDWTETMMSHWMNDHLREYYALQREFTTIAGKTKTIHVRTNGMSYDQCKAIAIKWFVAYENGAISKYRLD